MINQRFIKVSGVYIPEGSRPDPYFEKLYLSVRNKEHRVYTNNELLTLPDINLTHIHHDEWHVRKASSKKLIHYFEKKNKPLQILEIGCGNGWLSHKLAEIPQTKVTGLDINYAELEQGASVFLEKNLQFVYGDIRKNVLQNLQFDMIVFAASVSYFSSLHEIIKIAIQHLTVEGEIHLIDSFFYDKENILAAKQRCKTYYRELGFQEMADSYFHHLLDDFKDFNYVVMQEQNQLLKKIISKKSVFPWIRIQHSTAL